MLAGGSPKSGKVLFGEVNKWTGDVGIVRDKASLKVCEIKGANIFWFCRHGPKGNSI